MLSVREATYQKSGGGNRLSHARDLVAHPAKILVVRGFGGTGGYLRSLLALSGAAYNFKQFFLKTRRILHARGHRRRPKTAESGTQHLS